MSRTAGRTDTQNVTDLDNRAMAEIRGNYTTVLARALDRLLPMGKDRPKTLTKLCNALQTCTAVIPYLNPLDVLEMVNELSDKPPPRVDIVLPDVCIYANCCTVDYEFWEAVGKDLCLNRQFISVATDKLENEMLKESIKWFKTKKPGTEESLHEELYMLCRKKGIVLDGTTIVNTLQKMGYVHVDDDDATVTYCMPPRIDLLLLKEYLLGEKYLMYACQTSCQTIGGDCSIYQAAKYHRQYAAWNSYSDNDYDPDTFRFGESRFSTTIEVADVIAMCLLDGIAPNDRPCKLSGLLQILQPSLCEILYVIEPSKVLMYNNGLSKPRRLARKSNCVLGVLKGDRETIQLEPEGVLPTISAFVGSSRQENLQAGTMSAKTWQATLKQSKEFSTLISKPLGSMLQRRGAVLVQPTGVQKSSMVSRVSKWIDSYRGSSSTPCETELDAMPPAAQAGVQSTPKPLRELQCELIARCTGKLTRIPVSTVVALLQHHGYIAVDEEDPSGSVSYLIPSPISFRTSRNSRVRFLGENQRPASGRDPWRNVTPAL